MRRTIKVVGIALLASAALAGCGGEKQTTIRRETVTTVPPPAVVERRTTVETVPGAVEHSTTVTEHSY
jgi:hypothetical protein